ncbi:hypothetical protein [Streptomyces sp. NPDC002785]|uniref:hypothetical protein n=1 Tax=Streptomyces sp. NPDC002785 TaxID=3154543 RepID=UPI00332FC3DD
MAMTIKVYEVDRHGRTQVIRPKAEVVPLKAAPQKSAYPDCECDRCKGGQR